jgi:hypothetical protein
MRMNRYSLVEAIAVAWCVPLVLEAQHTVRAPLARDTVIDGIPCARTDTKAEFYASGRLLECPLSRDATIGVQTLPRGTWPQFDERGAMYGAWLSIDVELSGHRCRGDGYKKWSVRFHPGGALKSCYLPQPTVIDGVPCIDGSFWNEIRGGQKSAALFHPDGRLARCQAAREFTANGTRYPKWSVIAHDSTGKQISP